jgi:hypothetical protein
MVLATALYALVTGAIPVAAQSREPSAALTIAALEPPLVEPAAAQWRPLIYSSSIATEEIFPAEILALAMRPSAQVQPHYLGDPNGMFGVAIASPTANARVNVTITVDHLSQASTFEAVLPEANRPYEVWPTMRYDTRALAGVRESFPATAHFMVSVNGKPVGEQSRTIRVRSVNDVPLAYRTTNGQVHDVRFMFAAFVNENSPVIDQILKEALKFNAVQQFKGYQGTPQDVVREAFAIWNVLQRRGVRYSSITQPSGQSSSVQSQHVRFLDEVIDNDQANCVDGSVLFASVLYKLGIHPTLVLVPGHMFVGFFTDKQRRQVNFIETTMVGSPGLNSFQKGWTFLESGSYLSSRSYELFLAAVSRGNQQYQLALPSLRTQTPGYAVIDIDTVRKLGIAPIARF